jgi:hypothetical protein
LNPEPKQYRNIRQTSSACDVSAVRTGSLRMQNEVIAAQKSRVETLPFAPVTCG